MSVVLVKSVIGIQNYASSGSSLLQSLLDDHPDLISLPGLAGLNFHLHWRKMVEGNKNIKLNEIIRWVLKEFFKGLHDPLVADGELGLSTLGEDKNQNPCIDYNLLLNRFFGCLSLSTAMHGIRVTDFKFENHKIYRKCILYSVYCAYNGIFPSAKTARRSIVFPIHSTEPQDVQDLIEDFGEVKCIHMVRNPVSLFNSFVNIMLTISWTQKEARKSGSNLLDHGISQLFLDEINYLRPGMKMNSLTPFSRLESTDRSCSVRLEDLHRAPEAVMREVARWIGIRWQDTLLRTTFAGKLWWNRPTSVRISGIDRKISSLDHLPNMSRLDQMRIRALATYVNRRYGYGHDGALPPPVREILFGLVLLLTWWLPFRIERTAERVDASHYVRVRLRMLKCLSYTRRQWRDYVAPLPIPP